MRLDRLATLYVFRPLASPRRTEESPAIPILMYHAITEEHEDGHAYFHTTTSPEVFGAQLAQLRRDGYTTITLSRAAALLSGAITPNKAPVNPVVITFDDGFRDFYDTAFPLLTKHGATATMFLPTGSIGDERRQLHGRDCMTWSEVRELDAAGIEFGSHTVTHPHLKTLALSEVERELRDSKRAIEDALGKEASTFAYPYAFPETAHEFVGDLKRILVESGYTAGVSTIIGTASGRDDSFFLPRLPVNSSDDEQLFAAKLEGGYDWLHGVQRLKKSLAALVG